MSTGAGYSKRAMRTNAELFQIQVCTPILLNGIPEDLAERSDLASRTVVLELPALTEENQMDEDEFWDQFDEAHPWILGALLDGVVGALRNSKNISLEGYGRIRMTGFARWAEAGCRALGFAEDQFLNAFVANQKRAMEIVYKQDLVAQAVALLIEKIHKTEIQRDGEVTPPHC